MRLEAWALWLAASEYVLASARSGDERTLELARQYAARGNVFAQFVLRKAWRAQQNNGGHDDNSSVR